MAKSKKKCHLCNSNSDFSEESAKTKSKNNLFKKTRKKFDKRKSFRSKQSVLSFKNKIAETEEIKKLRREIETLKVQSNNSFSEDKRTTDKLFFLEKVKEFERKNVALEALASSEKERNAKLRKQLDDYEKKNRELQKENDSIKTRLQLRDDEVAALKIDLGNLKRKSSETWREARKWIENQRFLMSNRAEKLSEHKENSDDELSLISETEQIRNGDYSRNEQSSAFAETERKRKDRENLSLYRRRESFCHQKNERKKSVAKLIKRLREKLQVSKHDKRFLRKENIELKKQYIDAKSDIHSLAVYCADLKKSNLRHRRKTNHNNHKS
ncbi:hypothetical protein MHBO_000879 [Bonamia ostreae]|uniref:Uncharacterized protein n=1 Tax=Bonamia ostreae TaxID=126728 RepID=A0ABV2AHP1_9EUKA